MKRTLEAIFKSQWQPYIGPNGETGWTDGDEVIYDDEPPGPITTENLTDEEINERYSNNEKKSLEKQDWIPYVGPKGGEGWINVDSEEVDYGKEPPGNAILDSLDEFEDLLQELYPDDRVQAIFDSYEDPDLYTIVEDIQEVATDEEFEELMQRASEFSPDDSISSPEPGQGYKPEFSNDEAEDVIRDNISLDYDTFQTEFTEVDASEYEALLQEFLTYPDVGNLDEQSITQALASEIEGGYVPEYVIENFLQSVEETEQADTGEVENTYGKFTDNEEIAKIPPGTTVQVFSAFGIVVGELLENKSSLRVETADGDEETIMNIDIDSVNAYVSEPVEEHTLDNLLSENPSEEEVIEYANAVLLQVENRATNAHKSRASTFVQDTFDKGADGGVVYDQLKEANFDDYNLPKIVESIIERKTAEFNGEEFFAGKSYSQTNEINKRQKMFQEENDNSDRATETVKLMDDIGSGWTGGSTNDDTAVLWALADQMGQTNIPVGDDHNDLDEEAYENVTDEEIDMAREYVEYTRDTLRELFGDTITLYRGQKGDYASDKQREVKENGIAEADHRAVASWSVCPTSASKFAGTRGNGVIYKQDMDVEDMLMSMVTGIGLNGESEIIAMGGRKEYELKDEPSLEGDGIMPSDEVTERDMFEMSFEQFREYLG